MRASVLERSMSTYSFASLDGSSRLSGYPIAPFPGKSFLLVPDAYTHQAQGVLYDFSHGEHNVFKQTEDCKIVCIASF